MFDRRRFLVAAAGGACAVLPVAPGGAEARAGARITDFDALRARVAEMARRPYAPPQRAAGVALAAIGPDTFGRIGFRPEAALWSGGEGYEVHFLKPGRHAPYLIRVNEVDGPEARRVAYSPDQFDLAGLGLEAAALDAGGYGGFKVLYPLHPEHDWKDELVVFRGASYFRMLGRNQWYGISARGLAIDTALGHREEFPVFREFWLQRPADVEAPLRLLALLDSPSLCGAFAFAFRPGDWTRCTVTAEIHVRREVQKIGFAPLTSMFLHGESDRPEREREIHDSDGLQLHTGAGEHIWRPLAKRRGVNISTFADASPRGFGLMQRDRNPDHYPSPEKRYHMRPGYWVEPLHDWGRGRVELVEIGTTDEDFDNIVCFWTPDAPIRAGDVHRLDYRITALDGPFGWSGGGKTVKSIVRRTESPGSAALSLSGSVAFSGPRLADSQGKGDIVAVLNSPQASILDPQVILQDDRARLTFEAQAGEVDAVELRAYLKQGTDVLTETWSYLWTA